MQLKAYRKKSQSYISEMRVFQAILLSLVLFAIAEALPLRSRPDKVIRGKCVMQFAC